MKSKKQMNLKSEAYMANINKRGNVKKSLAVSFTQKGDDDERGVGTYMLAFFLFVVVIIMCAFL